MSVDAVDLLKLKLVTTKSCWTQPPREVRHGERNQEVDSPLIGCRVL